MHIRTIPAREVALSTRKKEMIRLFNKAYEFAPASVQLQANTTIPSHNMTPTDEEVHLSNSLLIQKGKDFLSLMVGIDLNLTTVNLPAKSEYFEPTAVILFDEYQDYLNRVLLDGKMEELYRVEAGETIEEINILLKELFLRFASEILQYHNEKERDGSLLIKGLFNFLDSLKASSLFKDSRGVFDRKIREFFRTSHHWLNLFKGCVDLVKKLNLNTEAITKGIAFLTGQRQSLMTILVAKYLYFSKLNQSLVDGIGAQIFSSLKCDLKHGEAISNNHLARTLLDYEETSFNILVKKACNKKFLKTVTLPEIKQSLISEFVLINIKNERKILIQMMDNYIGSHDQKNIDTILMLGESYQLIEETNQFMKIFEKLASLTKGFGWYVFIAGIINLTEFIKVLKEYSEKCHSHINNFSESPHFDSFSVLISAMIGKNTFNTFSLECNFEDLISTLDRLTNPGLLNQLANYFMQEIDELRELENLTGCKVINEEKFGSILKSLKKEKGVPSKKAIANPSPPTDVSEIKGGPSSTSPVPKFLRERKRGSHRNPKTKTEKNRETPRLETLEPPKKDDSRSLESFDDGSIDNTQIPSNASKPIPIPSSMAKPDEPKKIVPKITSGELAFFKKKIVSFTRKSELNYSLKDKEKILGLSMCGNKIILAKKDLKITQIEFIQKKNEFNDHKKTSLNPQELGLIVPVGDKYYRLFSSESISCLKMLNDSKMLVGLTDGSIHLFKDNRPKPIVSDNHSSGNAITCFEVISDDGNNLSFISASSDSSIKKWDLNSEYGDLRLISKVIEQGMGKSITSLSVMNYAKGYCIASGAADGLISLYLSNSTITNRDNKDSINCLALFKREDTICLVTGSDTRLMKWDIDLTSNKISEISSHAISIKCLLVYDNGNRLLSTGKDNFLRDWDIENDKEMSKSETSGNIENIFQLNDGNLVLASENQLQFWKNNIIKLEEKINKIFESKYSIKGGIS